MKEKTVGSPFFGVFTADRIQNVMKDVSVHFWIHSRNSCNYTSELFLIIPAKSGENL
jgi:hypothetical protein